MALTIYGSPLSRTMRVLWMAAELDLDYTHIPYEFDDPALKEPDFLTINPAGSIPAVTDDEFALAESLAINLYLAKKYGRDVRDSIYPVSLEEEAEVVRWSQWAQAHLEHWVQRDELPVDLRSAITRHAATLLRPGLALLNTAVTTRDWLVGDHFSVADLNVAAVLSPSRADRIDFSDYPAAGDWLTRCYDRPAARATRSDGRVGAAAKPAVRR